MHPLQVGTMVVYRRGWTTNSIRFATVVNVDLSDSGELLYDLTDGHWCYAGQIVSVISNEGLAQDVHK